MKMTTKKATWREIMTGKKRCRCSQEPDACLHKEIKRWFDDLPASVRKAIREQDKKGDANPDERERPFKNPTTDDFEAALKDRIDLETWTESAKKVEEGARWAREYTLAEKHTPCGCAWCEGHACGEIKVRAQIRKLWDSVIKAHPDSPRDITLEFERKLKALEAQDASMPISRKGNRELEERGV